MNCTKLTPPSPHFVNFYIYYSYSVLSVTLIIAPLQIYIVLTQSQKLGKLKWLILHHTIWCLFFEIPMTISKPLILSPVFAGYLVGLIKYGNHKLSTLAAYFALLIGEISVAALTSTLRSRYLMVFETTKWYNPRRGLLFNLCLIIGVSVPLGLLFLPVVFMDSEHVHQIALNYEPCLQYYFTDPGFLFFSQEKGSKILIIIFCIMAATVILSILIALFFIYLVKTNSTVTLTKLKTSLMVSAIVQLSVTICFYLIPITAFLGILAFQIPHTEHIMIITICIFLSHSFLEFCVTLYFVRPYRKAVVKLFHQIFKIKNPSKVSVVTVLVKSFQKSVSQ